MNKRERNRILGERIVICRRTKGGTLVPVCEHDYKPSLSPAYEQCHKCGFIRKVERPVQ